MSSKKIKLILVGTATALLFSCSGGSGSGGGNAGDQPTDFAFSGPGEKGVQISSSDIIAYNKMIDSAETDLASKYLLNPEAQPASAGSDMTEPSSNYYFYQKSNDYKTHILDLKTKCAFRKISEPGAQLEPTVGSSSNKTLSQTIGGASCPVQEKITRNENITVTSIEKENENLKSYALTITTSLSEEAKNLTAESQKATGLVSQSVKANIAARISADKNTDSNSSVSNLEAVAVTVDNHTLQLNLKMRSHQSSMSSNNIPAQNGQTSSTETKSNFKKQYEGDLIVDGKVSKILFQKSVTNGKVDFQKLYVNGFDESTSGFKFEKLLGDDK